MLSKSTKKLQFPDHLKSEVITAYFFIPSSSIILCSFLTLGSSTNVQESTQLYFFVKVCLDREAYSDWQQVVDIKCHYWAIHTPPCLCPLLSEKCSSFSHSSWPCSKHVSPFKGHGRLGKFSDFVKGWPRWWFIRHPLIIFQTQMMAMNHAYKLTAPFLTNVDLLHTSWMANLLSPQSLPTCLA